MLVTFLNEYDKTFHSYRVDYVILHFLSSRGPGDLGLEKSERD